MRAELLLGALERHQGRSTASKAPQDFGTEAAAEPAEAGVQRGGGSCTGSAGAGLPAGGVTGWHAAGALGADAQAFLERGVQYEGQPGAERLVDSEGKAVMMRCAGPGARRPELRAVSSHVCGLETRG